MVDGGNASISEENALATAATNTGASSKDIINVECTTIATPTRATDQDTIDPVQITTPYRKTNKSM